MASTQILMLISILFFQTAACGGQRAMASSILSQKNDKNEIKKIIEALRKKKNSSANPGGPSVSRSRRGASRDEAGAMGALRVVTEATEAEVTIKRRGEVVDEGHCEKGLFQSELAAGEYDVEVTSALVVVFAGKVTIRPSKVETINAAAPRTGSVIIDFQYLEDIDAEEVSILIDDRQVLRRRKISEGEEATRIEVSGVPVGARRIVFSHPAIREVEQRIEVIEGTININPPFEKTKGRVFVRSQPGASVYLDGALQGAVTEIGVSEPIYINPGKHTIRVEKQGFVAAETSRLFDQSDLLIELKLTEKTGRMQSRASGEAERQK